MQNPQEENDATNYNIQINNDITHDIPLSDDLTQTKNEMSYDNPEPEGGETQCVPPLAKDITDDTNCDIPDDTNCDIPYDTNCDSRQQGVIMSEL